MSKSGISRREFLKGSAVSAAAAAVALSGIGTKVVGAEEAVTEAVTEAASGAAIYTPGTYTASATGMGTVTMTATFDETSIIDIQLDVSQETDSIGQAAADELISQCLEAQSSDIDGVSGATLTSDAVKTCLDNCIAQASGTTVEEAVVDYAALYGSNYNWLGEAPVIDDSEIAETYDCDILVIGGGNSGVPCARKAAELGKKVIVMEMLSEDAWAPLGCDVGTVNSQAFQDLCDGDTVDEIAVYNEWMRRTYDRSNQHFAYLYATRSGEAQDYMREVAPEEELEEFSVYYNFPNGRYYDGENHYQVNHSGYTSFPGTISYRDFYNTLGGGENQPAWKAIMQYSIEDAQNNGAEWLWGTSAVVLCQNEAGDVTGAIGKDADGNYIKVNATATVCSAGDFSGNGEMVLGLMDEVRELAEACGVELNPDNFRGMGQNGMGHKLMLWAGAVMEPGPRAAMNFGNGAGSPSLAAFGNYPVFGSDGKRFYNDAMLQFGGQGFFARRPAGERLCTIMDSNWNENMAYMGYEHNVSSCTCEREWDLVVQSMEEGVEAYHADPETAGPEGFDTYCFTGYGLEKGSHLYVADTLDELADYLGYEGDAKQGLLDEIAHYNEMCEAGADTDFGRDASLMLPIQDGPFFGVSTVTSKGRVSSGMVQMSGVLTTDNNEVLRSDDTIINGLYAVGNDCGGRYAIQYHTLMAGNSVGSAVTHGYCLGEYLGNL
ncbi:MAG: FAD-binding protein [Lachnospiraceae bacterium]|nr:FAD-binding protein [Lachnospiraceae bacterium]